MSLRAEAIQAAKDAMLNAAYEGKRSSSTYAVVAVDAVLATLNAQLDPADRWRDIAEQLGEEQ